MKEILTFLRDVLDEFTDVIKEIIKPRTFFAFMFYVTFCWLIIRNRNVPPELNTIVSTLTGFWFSNKIEQMRIDKNNNGENK